VTAEVAIMNEHVLVLAADSATTVTMLVAGERKTRFFRGANKLFQLSRVHPVGLMIHDAATLQGVPWELLIKEFRVSLDDKSYERLSEYPKVLFEFLSAHSRLFPPADRDRTFLTNVIYAMLALQRRIRESDAYVDAPDDRKNEIFAEGIRQALAELTARQPTTPITTQDIDAAIVRHKDAVVAELNKEWVPYAPEFTPIVEEIGIASIRELMVNYKAHLSKTGVVIGGYGDHEYYPSFELHTCYGFLADRFIFAREDRSRSIERGAPGVIEGFAQDNMIDTFRFGLAFDAYAQVNRATKKALTQLAEKTLQRYSPATGIDAVEDLITEELSAHQDDWFEKVRSEHYAPLARVISSLPVVDLAALAKSLVELQSLKERVTRDTESVGGPIDVAVISKHDGFVWIDRKHYFRPELNPRFFKRIKSERQ
jgi:hypothetical protein